LIKKINNIFLIYKKELKKKLIQNESVNAKNANGINESIKLRITNG